MITEAMLVLLRRGLLPWLVYYRLVCHRARNLRPVSPGAVFFQMERGLSPQDGDVQFQAVSYRPEWSCAGRSENRFLRDCRGARYALLRRDEFEGGTLLQRWDSVRRLTCSLWPVAGSDCWMVEDLASFAVVAVDSDLFDVLFF